MVMGRNLFCFDNGLPQRVNRGELLRRSGKENGFEDWLAITREGVAQPLEILDDPCVIHLEGVQRNRMVDPMDRIPLVLMAGEQLGDSHRSMGLTVHEKLDDLRAKRPDSRPLANGVGLIEAAYAQDVERVARPAQHRNRLDDGKRRGVIRPSTTIGQASRMLRHVLTEVGWCGSGGHRHVNRQALVVVAKARVMGGLVDVDGACDGIPSRNK